MTLVEAMRQARNGQIIQRKYHILNGMSFTQWGEIETTDAGKFFKAGWLEKGGLKLKDLEADNWEIVA